jgi:transcription elongation factor Elf1
VPFGKGPAAKYRMRPICPACNQRPCAVNYIKDGVKHYRARCDNCLRKGRGIKKRIPRWEAAGYKKKMVCDKCGFKARYSAQTLVYHVDGDLNNVAPKNLKTVCRNCEVDLAKSDSVWRPGDLQPDL